MTSVPIKWGSLDTDTRAGRAPHRDTGRDGETQPQPKEEQRLKINHQKLTRGLKQALPRSLTMNQPCRQLDAGCPAKNHETMNACHMSHSACEHL